MTYLSYNLATKRHHLYEIKYTIKDSSWNPEQELSLDLVRKRNQN